MNDDGKFLYKKESYDIIAACQEVWKEFGGSFKESVIDKAVGIVLQNKGYQVENQKRIDIYFKDKKVGVYVPDRLLTRLFYWK